VVCTKRKRNWSSLVGGSKKRGGSLRVDGGEEGTGQGILGEKTIRIRGMMEANMPRIHAV